MALSASPQAVKSKTSTRSLRSRVLIPRGATVQRSVTSVGDLWVLNGNGMILHLKAKRTGLMLSLGVDAVVIMMEC